MVFEFSINIWKCCSVKSVLLISILVYSYFNDGTSKRDDSVYKITPFCHYWSFSTWLYKKKVSQRFFIYFFQLNSHSHSSQETKATKIVQSLVMTCAEFPRFQSSKHVCKKELVKIFTALFPSHPPFSRL